MPASDHAPAESLVRILWRRRRPLLLLFTLTMAAAAGITFALPKRYTTTAYLAVEQRGANGIVDTTQATQLLTRTYAELMQSSVAATIDVPGVTGGNVTVTAVPQSQLLAVEGTGASPPQAKALADMAAQEFERQVRRLGESGRTSGEVQLVQRAAVPSAPSAPRPALYLAVAAVVAAMLAATGAVLADKVDRRLVVPVDAFELDGVRIVGRFPSGTRAPGVLADAAHVVLSNLLISTSSRFPASVAVLSGGVGEGRTTIALALARAGADRVLRVLLVEADLRRPSLALRLHGAELNLTGGLCAMLSAPGQSIDDYLTVIDDDPRLSLLPAGDFAASPASAVRPERLELLQREAEKRFDLVIYDTPALSIGPEARFVSAMAAVRLVVVDGRHGDQQSVRRVLDHLGGDGDGQIGLLLNRVATKGPAAARPTGDRRHDPDGADAIGESERNSGVLDAKPPYVES